MIISDNVYLQKSFRKELGDDFIPFVILSEGGEGVVGLKGMRG